MQTLKEKLDQYFAARDIALRARGIDPNVPYNPGYANTPAPQQEGIPGLNTLLSQGAKKGIRELLGGSGGLAGTAATQAAWNTPAMLASQAAWNAPGLAATEAVSLPSFLGGGTAAAEGGMSIGAAAGAGEGAAATTGALSGLGTAAAIAAPLILAYLGHSQSHKPLTHYQENRLKALENAGITGFSLGENFGVSRDEQLKRALESGDKSANIDFLRTGEEKYLRPEDIVGDLEFGFRYGNDWNKFVPEEKLKRAAEVLGAGAYREGRGRGFIDWDKVPTQRRVLTGDEPDFYQLYAGGGFDEIAPGAFEKAEAKVNGPA